ncbi:MAG: GlxA family transcriptional regulator [Herminiimonas sp.]|nr:GlxA family transcriptional regulator [Herminiimonas sp.]
MNVNTKLSVAFVLAPNFTMVAFSAFVDTLRLAADEGDRSRQIGCTWTVLSHDMRPIRASCGIEITPTSELPEPSNFNYIVVVGGLLDGPKIAPSLGIYLKRAAALGVPLAGICTGSFILARLGLMQQYRTCVSWFHYNHFVGEFPELEAISDELFVVDRDRLTCAGGTRVVHLAAFLVERHCNKAQAAKALRILIETRPLPANSPQPQPLLSDETDNLRVRKAMLLVERNLSTPLSAEFIAQHVNVSNRHLERLFLAEIGMSPSAFSLKLRLDNAYHLLETTTNSIIDIAMQCGFQSNSHFSRSFRSVHGMTPSQVRERSCGTQPRQRVRALEPVRKDVAS